MQTPPISPGRLTENSEQLASSSTLEDQLNIPLPPSAHHHSVTYQLEPLHLLPLSQPRSVSQSPREDTSAKEATVPNITLHLTSHPAMEPNWQSHQGFYYYEGGRPEPRPSASPTTETGPSSSSDDHAHRRSNTQPTFLPPPPPHTATAQHMNLPPFASSFYDSYHPGGHGPSSSAPAGLGMAYGSGNGPISTPGQGYPYPMTSPLGLPGGAPLGRPPHSYESPRMPPGPANWSSSPGIRHLSPISPTTHLAPPGVSSASTSSSSYPSATRTPGNLPTKSKRRSGSTSHSIGSWDEDKYGNIGDLGEETEDQPWGMPQDEYKALNPRDKKQVRNRIGARRFRAKRKNYVTNIEASLRHREEECANLRAQLESHRAEINDLRGRLGMPMLPPPPPPESGLGLVVNQGEWEDRKPE